MLRLCLKAVIGLTVVMTSVAGTTKSETVAAAPAARVEGSRLSVALPGGGSLTGSALVGAVLTIADANGSMLDLRIDDASADPADGNRWLYQLSFREAQSDAWADYCDPDPDGRTLAMPVAGTVSPEGHFDLSDDSFMFSCTSGVVAKCILWGYDPFARNDGTSADIDHFRSCLRMARADYCGDGRSFTRTGTPINLFDRIGIQISEPAPDMSFEAAWGPDGAVCVRKTRHRDLISTDELIEMCPRLNARNVGTAGCQTDGTASISALMFNDS